jgi:hypothetical protein
MSRPRSIRHDEVAAARDLKRQRRRLRFNFAQVAPWLGLGEFPAEVLDVEGLCSKLHIRRDALEILIDSGLPHTDISPTALRVRHAPATEAAR